MQFRDRLYTELLRFARVDNYTVYQGTVVLAMSDITETHWTSPLCLILANALVYGYSCMTPHVMSPSARFGIMPGIPNY